MRINLRPAIAAAIGAELSPQGTLSSALAEIYQLPAGSSSAETAGSTSFLSRAKVVSTTTTTTPQVDSDPLASPTLAEIIAVGDWHEDMEFGQRSEFSLPPSFKSEQVSGSVWNAWYGSAKAANRAAEILSGVRVPEATLLKRSVCASLPTTIISVITANRLIFDLYQNAMTPAEAKAANPAYRLEKNLAQLIGDRYDACVAKLPQAEPVAIAEDVLKAWPFMQTLYDNGCYGLFHASTLLLLAGLRDKFMGADLLKGTDRHRALLAVNLLLNALPPRLSALVMVTTPAFKDALSHAPQFFGLTAINLDPEQSIWDQIGQEATHSTIVNLMAAAKTVARRGNASATLLAVHDLEVRQVIFAGQPRTIQSVYLTFCRDEAGPRYRQLLAALNQYSAALEIKINQLPADLVGRDVDFASAGVDPALLHRVKRLVSEELQTFDIADFLVSAETRMARVEEMHDKLTDLMRVRSVTSMLQLSKLAVEAREEILSNQGWFQEVLGGSKSYVGVWESFYADLSAMRPVPAIEKAKPVKQDMVLRSAPVAVPVPESVTVQTLRNSLEMAEVNEEHLREELRVSRAEAHNLRHKAEALHALAPLEGQIACDTDLIRRVTMRDSLRADEVLAYFEFIGCGQLDVLKSAWRSASEYAVPFAHANRMIDLLDKLVFAYLPLITNGTSDAQARQVFGTKAYKSVESDTTICSTRMRKMREFDYQGERRVFERHLCVSNGTGRDGMRIYFDVIDGRVCIAYVGPHLDVKSTN